MARCGNVCDASNTIVTWTPVLPIAASLFSEGTVVEITINHSDKNLKFSANGLNVSRTGKQAQSATVVVSELNCSLFYRAAYNQWANDVFACGDLIINTDCCNIPIIIHSATVEPELKDIEIDDNTPVTLTFEGILEKPGNYGGSIGIGNPLVLT